jgi:hypothetical protein
VKGRFRPLSSQLYFTESRTNSESVARLNSASFVVVLYSQVGHERAMNIYLGQEAKNKKALST